MNVEWTETQRVRFFKQTTLKNEVRCEGVALHGGERVSMTLCPAEPDTGIVFHRTDIGARIPARFDNVSDTRLCTSLTNEDGAGVGTIEHLMAALAGCEVDNAIVALDGPEVPIMDGSAEPFVALIEAAGLTEQDAPRHAIQILAPVSVADGDAHALIEPVSFDTDRLVIELGIDFDSRAIGRQDYSVTLTSKTFKSQICRARTFGFLDDVEALRSAGLARGGSLDNAVVVNGDAVMNAEGLRYEDEFVRHKILDCIGDLYLAGAQLVGCFTGYRAGHALNNKLLRALFADRSAWVRVPLDELIVLPHRLSTESPVLATA